MPHRAEALVETVDLDVFNPPRADWMNKETISAWRESETNKTGFKQAYSAMLMTMSDG